MLQHCKRLMPMVPWRSYVLQQQLHPVPIKRNFWGWYRPSEFRGLMREVDRAMEKFEREVFDHFPFRRLTPKSLPIQGVVQRGEVFRINVDVDGFKPEEITISLKENTLAIEAKMDRKMEDGSKLQQEFKRETTLPDEVDETSLKSFLRDDGILMIEAAYKLDRKPKEIPVNRQ